jgi:hypothetical protein
MVATAVQDVAPATIEATLNYLLDTGEMPSVYTGGPGSTVLRTSSTSDPQRVLMHNGRLETDRLTLDRNGFHFVRHDTKVVDFDNEDELRRVYYPEMEALVKAETGATRVVVFDHTLRTANEEDRQARKIREVVQRVHNDYTEWSGPQRVRDLLPQEADELLKRRFAIVQVWRPIRHPVETFSARHLRCRQRLVARLRDIGAPLSQPRRPDLCGHLQSRAPLVLVPADATRRGPGIQGLRFLAGWPGALDCPYGFR